MSEQRLGSVEISVAAGIVGCLFVLGAAVADRLAPDDGATIVTGLAIAVTAVAILAITASLEEKIPEAVPHESAAQATAAPQVAALHRWIETIDRADEADNAQLITVLRNPLQRVAIGLGARELPGDAQATQTPESLLEAVERL